MLPCQRFIFMHGQVDGSSNDEAEELLDLSTGTENLPGTQPLLRRTRRMHTLKHRAHTAGTPVQAKAICKRLGQHEHLCKRLGQHEHQHERRPTPRYIRQVLAFMHADTRTCLHERIRKRMRAHMRMCMQANACVAWLLMQARALAALHTTVRHRL